MSSPKWFYVIVSLCVIVVSAAGVYRLVQTPNQRYDGGNARVRLDTTTGDFCYWQDEFYARCVDWKGRTITDVAFSHVTPKR